MIHLLRVVQHRLRAAGRDQPSECAAQTAATGDCAPAEFELFRPDLIIHDIGEAMRSHRVSIGWLMELGHEKK